MLLDQYFSLSNDVYSEYVTKSNKLIDLINSTKFKMGIKDLNNIKNHNEINDLIVHCNEYLRQDKDLNDNIYLYSRHEYMNLHCDIIANAAYVSRQNSDDYQFYQKVKELFLLLQDLYISSSKINDLT